MTHATKRVSTNLHWWLLFLLALVARPLYAGKPVLLGKQHTTAGKSFVDIDHAEWGRLLNRFVDDQGLVNYKAWKGDASALRSLDEYLAELSSLDLSAQQDKGPAQPLNQSATQNQASGTDAGATSSPQSLARHAKLAYWINAYNAVTVRGILREYPTSSIRNHTPKLFGYHIWHDLQLQVDGQRFSLDQIEHAILRKLNEPRIHFAIVCASMGCPPLRNEAYLAQTLDRQLDANARLFFARPENFRYDAAAKRFRLSAIINWFAADFGDTQAARLRYLSPWFPTPAAKRGATQRGVSVRYAKYDWQLNQQRP